MADLTSAMPLGYLAGVLIVGGMTLMALAAPRLPGHLHAVTYPLGVGLNELPFAFCCLLAASTLLALGQGDLQQPGGWAAFGLAVLAATGLAVVARRGAQAGPAVAGALDEALGSGWRSAIGTDIARRLRRRPPYARILCWPFPLRPRAVARVRNISYGVAGRRNLLDVYHRRDRPPGAPALVYFHGGAYFSGHKHREALPLLHRLAGQGWVCVSANYRLRPRATFPDHLVDAKKAIAWTRQHVLEYGGDPATVFVVGSSAGGHLATLAALTPNDPALQPDFADADTSVTAAISLCGYYGRYYGDDRAEEIPSTPFAYDATDAPPIFMAHGDRDTLVPVDTARHLATRLRSMSANPVVYVQLPGGHHAFDLFHSLRFEAVVDGIEAFAAWVRSRTRSAPSWNPTESGRELEVNDV